MSFIARIGARIHTSRSLYLDDYIVLAGVICLCAAAGIVFKNSNNYSLGNAALQDPSLSNMSPHQIDELFKPYKYIYAALIWTTIFAVKFSFLIFFKKLIERVTKIHTYYWIVIVITVISWLFTLVEPFIICPHFGYSTRRIISIPPIFEDTKPDSVQCYDSLPELRFGASTSWLVTSLDIITDVCSKSLLVHSV